MLTFICQKIKGILHSYNRNLKSELDRCIYVWRTYSKAFFPSANCVLFLLAIFSVKIANAWAQPYCCVTWSKLANVTSLVLVNKLQMIGIGYRQFNKNSIQYAVFHRINSVIFRTRIIQVMHIFIGCQKVVVCAVFVTEVWATGWTWRGSPRV